MVKPSQRSRTFRRVFRRTPGGNVSLQFKKRKPSKAKCGSCQAELKGVPRERPAVMRGLAKTKKRPERPFGGVLCSACTRRKALALARA